MGKFKTYDEFVAESLKFITESRVAFESKTITKDIAIKLIDAVKKEGQANNGYVYLGSGNTYYKVDALTSADESSSKVDVSVYQIIVDTQNGGLFTTAGLSYTSVIYGAPTQDLNAFVATGSGPDTPGAGFSAKKFGLIGNVIGNPSLKPDYVSNSLAPAMPGLKESIILQSKNVVNGAAGDNDPAVKASATDYIAKLGGAATAPTTATTPAPAAAPVAQPAPPPTTVPAA